MIKRKFRKMKRIPRKRAIDLVLAGHIDDIEEWVLRGDRESLKVWLYKTLDLGRMPVKDMKREFSAYLELCDSEEEFYDSGEEGDGE
jgi:hypothetical protein